MNVEDLKKAVVNWNESRDRGDESIENPFVVYFEDERGETNGEKISYIEHMHAQVTLELESEAKALAEQTRQLKAELDKVNVEYNKCVEENNQMDSILKKIYELKRLHAISQNEAQNIFPQSAPELRHLSHLQIQDDELQNNIDNLNKEMTEVLNKLEDSKERLSETVAEYEEKKNQEEHKLELLVVIQNVVKKKREQILERNATIVELKNESIEIEVI
jgi:chromosome segregation ATPase